MAAVRQTAEVLRARSGFIDIWLMDSRQPDSGRAELHKLEARASDCLKRCLLPAYVGQQHDIVYLRAGRGKPTLGLSGAGGHDFNLSHSKGVTVMAVSDAGEVGIDIESRFRNPSERMLHWLFRPSSQADYVLNSAYFKANFVNAWTLNEAFGKAKGVGLQRRSLASALLRQQEQQGGAAHLQRTAFFKTRIWRCWQFCSDDFIMTITLRNLRHAGDGISVGRFNLIDFGHGSGGYPPNLSAPDVNKASCSSTCGAA